MAGEIPLHPHSQEPRPHHQQVELREAIEKGAVLEDMSGMTCADAVTKPLAWLHGEVRTPPLSREARLGQSPKQVGRALGG